ncbi:MMPL family transporter, partial [Streptomyces anthocyanicus]
IVSVADPYTAQAVSRDGSTAYVSVAYEVNAMELTDETREALKQAGHAAQGKGLTVELGGDALQTMPETGAGEIVGVVVAGIVLVLTFGS